MASPHLYLLLLLFRLVLGTAMLADPTELHIPKMKDSSGRLFLRAISGLQRVPSSTQRRSPQPPAPWQPSRERKPGCKAFFWKTLTVC